MVYKSDSLLFYARSTNQGITWEPIMEVDSGSYPSLCLDNSGMPRITYLRNDTVFCKTLKTDNTWHKTILFGGNGNLKPGQPVIAQTYPKDLGKYPYRLGKRKWRNLLSLSALMKVSSGSIIYKI